MYIFMYTAVGWVVDPGGVYSGPDPKSENKNPDSDPNLENTIPNFCPIKIHFNNSTSI